MIVSVQGDMLSWQLCAVANNSEAPINAVEEVVMELEARELLCELLERVRSSAEPRRGTVERLKFFQLEESQQDSWKAFLALRLRASIPLVNANLASAIPDVEGSAGAIDWCSLPR